MDPKSLVKSAVWLAVIGGVVLVASRVASKAAQKV